MKPAIWKRICSRFHLQERSLRWIIAGFLPASVAGWLVGKVLPLYTRQTGVGMLGVGIVFASYQLLVTVFALPAGWAADRYNRARVYRLGTALVLVGYLALLGPISLSLLVGVMLIFSLGADLSYASYYSLTLDLVPQEKRGAVFGLFHTLTFLLPMGAGLLLGVLLEQGFTAIFSASASFGLIALLMQLPIRDLHREGALPQPVAELGGHGVGDRPNAAPKGLMSRVQSPLRVFLSDMGASWSVFTHNRDLVSLVVMGTLGSLSYGVSAIYFIIYFSEVLKFGSMELGVLLSLGATGSVLAGIVSGLLSDRMGRRRVLVISALGSAALTVAFVYVHSFELMSAVFFLLTLFGGLWPPTYQVLLGELTPDAYRARVFSFMDVFTTGGVAVGPLLGGWLWTALGPSSVFVTDAMLTVVCGIWVLLAIGRRDRGTPTGQ